tara:strand:- start:1227 stop:2342 length:1116 start_codon:yes stop_codon:yes gene_type:complete
MELKNSAMFLAMLVVISAFTGCVDDDEDTTTSDPGEDGGYEYATNVDSHRLLVDDVCDIKALVEEFKWSEIETIYKDGVHSDKGSSMRTLQGFASAEGKKHPYDDYYNETGSIDKFIMSAIEGTGIFANASNSVREQAIEKGIQNVLMTAYVIHELNTAIDKETAGTANAVHNWDEGWAFFHGASPGCGPYATGGKRAGNFGTDNPSLAILEEMKAGRDLLNNDGITTEQDNVDAIVKNLVITYSQAAIRYASKMTSDETLAAAQTHQAEGMAFWMVIEPLVATYTSGCYNMDTHQASYADAATCAAKEDGNYTWIPNWGANDINSKVYDLSMDLEQARTDEFDFKANVEKHLQPVWDHFGITSTDIGTLQ